MHLSKSIIFIFLLISFPLFISAQVVGLKIGLNNSHLLIENSLFPEYNHKTKDFFDIHVGITVDIKINKLISIEPGLIYFGKTLSTTVNEPNFPIFDSEYKLTYINVPLPIRFNYKKNDNTFFGFIGPYLDLGTKGRLAYKGRGNFANHEIWTKEERRLKKFDYGTTFGIGFSLSKLQFQLFSNVGLADIATDFEGNTSAKNKTFGISITLRLGKHGTDFD